MKCYYCGREGILCRRIASDYYQFICEKCNGHYVLTEGKPKGWIE